MTFKSGHYGYCNDDTLPEVIQQKDYSKKKRRNKRERDLRHTRHLKYLAEHLSHYPVPVVYVDRVWIKKKGYVDNPKPYYKRLYRDNHKGGRYKYHKRYANKCVRRYGGELHRKGNLYRRVFDYWWSVE